MTRENKTKNKSIYNDSIVLPLILKIQENYFQKKNRFIGPSETSGTGCSKQTKYW